MITLFNRRELITVLSLEQLFRIRTALSDAGIPYQAKPLNQGGLGHMRGRTATTIFLKPDYLNQYKIYVHQEDYDRAYGVIQRVL